MVPLRSLFFSSHPILVAEAEEINKIVIQKYLEKFGLSCEIVSNAYALLKSISLNQYSMILIDYKLPPMNGYEATRLIRAFEKNGDPKIPIVVLTTEAISQARKKGEEVGVDDYLIQPLDIYELESIFYKWLEPVLREDSLQKLVGYHIDGQPLLQVLAEDYFVSAPLLIKSLEEAVLSQDLKKVRYYSHALKSSSLILGLSELGYFCQKLEITMEIESSTVQNLKNLKLSFEKCEPILRQRILEN